MRISELPEFSFLRGNDCSAVAVLARERVDDAAVELLVDDEMAEPARADDADADVARASSRPPRGSPGRVCSSAAASAGSAGNRC